MKAKHHIPTENYGFVEVEEEVESIGEAIGNYNRARGLNIHPDDTLPLNMGLDPKEWNHSLDGYLTVGNIPSDVYERMSPEQQRVMQEIKKAFKRLNPPEKRT